MIPPQLGEAQLKPKWLQMQVSAILAGIPQMIKAIPIEFMLLPEGKKRRVFCCNGFGPMHHSLVKYLNQRIDLQRPDIDQNQDREVLVSRYIDI